MSVSPVLAVHVVGAGPGVVAQPDAEVLNLQRLPLLDLLHGHDLARGLLELPQLPQEVPEAGLGHDGVRSEDPHSVERSLGLVLRWHFATNHAKFSQCSLSSHCRGRSRI